MRANMRQSRLPIGVGRLPIPWKLLTLSFILALGFYARAAHSGIINYLPSEFSGGDQFEGAVMELISEATEQGKEVVIRRSYYGNVEEGVVLLPQRGKSSSTVVFSVEIKAPGGTDPGSTPSLLENQEEIIRGLNLICADQLAAGDRLRMLLDQGGEMEMGMRGFASGVDGVAVESAGTSSEVAGLSSISVNTDRTLKNINTQLQSLDRVVDALASSMGEVSQKVGDLARSGDPWGEEDGSDDDHRSGNDEDSDHNESDAVSSEGVGGGIGSDGDYMEVQSEE